MDRHKKIAIIAGALILALTLAACGQGKEDKIAGAPSINQQGNNVQTGDNSGTKKDEPANADEAAIGQQENNAQTDDISGQYVYYTDGSTLSITADTDNSYRAELELFRLTGINDFAGRYENGILTMTGTDTAGDPITVEITFSDGQAILTITDSTWTYLAMRNGTQYVFDKSKNPPASTDEPAVGQQEDSSKVTVDEILDAFINGSISAVDPTDQTTFSIADLNMDSGEWDSYSIGDREDLDNDGENELIICGPYGGIYLDVRDGKVYKFAAGEGDSLVLSYVVYNGSTWVMYSNRMHTGYEAYHMEKFEGADNLVAEMNFNEELADEENVEGEEKYTLNGADISYEEYYELCSKIFATEVTTN